MKTKIIFRTAVSLMVVFTIALAMAFTAKESNGSANSVLTLKHITLTNGTAYASSGGLSFTGTVTGAKTTFVNMPAGYYNITICGKSGGVNHAYYNGSFYCNGGDQAATITINPGTCKAVAY